MKNEDFVFQFSSKNWKLKIKNLFSIFNFESKLKCAKMPFCVSILNWKFNGTFSARIVESVHRKCHSIFSLKLKWKSAYLQSVHWKCHSVFILKLEWKMTFLCISISMQNWKFKKDSFQFSIFIEKLKNKIFLLRFSIFSKY